MGVKLLAFAASARGESINRRLLALAVKQAEAAGAQVTAMEYAECASPLYYGEAVNALPEGAARLSRALQAHQGVLIATPEYNWSMPGSLKNLIDWLSIDPAAPLKGRSALLMCASPSLRGGIMGLQQLREPLEHLGMHVYPHVLGIGEADMQLGDDALARKKDQEFFSSCIGDFIRVTGLIGA